MPTTINVGLSKKIGLRDFGSAGASCNIQFEADHGLLTDDLAAFHQRVKSVFAACRDAVCQELARQQGTEASANGQSNAGTRAEAPAQPATAATVKPQNGNGHVASEKQVAYLRQLAKQVEGLGIRRLDALANRMFNKPLAALSSFDASVLIDTLKRIKAGDLTLDNVSTTGAAP